MLNGFLRIVIIVLLLRMGETVRRVAVNVIE